MEDLAAVGKNPQETPPTLALEDPLHDRRFVHIAG